MSTLATADLSSDESDTDFVLPEPKPKAKRIKRRSSDVKKVKKPRIEGEGEGEGDESESVTSSEGSSSSDSDRDQVGEDEERKAKAEEEVAERRRRAKEEFEKMRAEASGRTSTARGEAGSSSQPTASVEAGGSRGVHGVPAEMVEVQRARRFAGETIYETVKLPANDPEAVAYLSRDGNVDATQLDTQPSGPLSDEPLVQSETNHISDLKGRTGGADVPSIEPTSAATSGFNPSSASTTPASAPASALTTATAVTTAAPRPKAPIRRKPRQSLESMSAALDKGKKMTTLEKSQMDWKSHTSSEIGMEDELRANRRNGGYLDKRDFLDRVEERRAAGGAGGAGSGVGGRR